MIFLDKQGKGDGEIRANAKIIFFTADGVKGDIPFRETAGLCCGHFFLIQKAKNIADTL